MHDGGEVLWGNVEGLAGKGFPWKALEGKGFRAKQKGRGEELAGRD